MNDIFHDLDLLRKTQPVIHNLTNLVAMPVTANILLALGALPFMAHAPEELKDVSAISQTLVLNMGTLDKSWEKSADIAQQSAVKNHLPIIFDPAGAGATLYRTETAQKILQKSVHVLRGNASEIINLAKALKKLEQGPVSAKSKGVDASHSTSEAYESAKTLAKKYRCTVVVSGKNDLIIDREREIFIPYGTPIFTKVTGMGCSATAVIGAFCAVNSDCFLAAKHAVAVFKIAGEIAAKNSSGPGTFAAALLDRLYLFSKKDLPDNFSVITL